MTNRARKATEPLLGLLVVGLLFVLFHVFGSAGDSTTTPPSLFVWLFRQWMQRGGDFSHAWLMPLISLAFLWIKRKELATAERRVQPAGLILIAGLLALHWAGVRGQQPRLSIMVLAALTWAIPFFLYGPGIGRLLLFPCAYLFLCVSSYFMVKFTFQLRLFASMAANGVLHGLGVAAERSGTAIASPAGGGIVLEIADACSGLRSLVVMTALAAPYAYLTQPTLKRKWVLFLSSVPLAVLANVVRIVTIVLAAQLLGQDKALRLYHDFSGYLVFVIAILLLIAVGAAVNINYTEKLRQWKAAASKPT